MGIKMKSYTEIVVRYAETDQMGVVHHAVYPVWFEAARTDFSAKMGITYPQMEEMGTMLPVVELQVHYLGSARYGETVQVETCVQRLTSARVEFAYRVLDQQQRVITTGKTVHAWVGKDMRPMGLRKHFPQIYEKMLEAMEPESQQPGK